MHSEDEKTYAMSQFPLRLQSTPLTSILPRLHFDFFISSAFALRAQNAIIHTQKRKPAGRPHFLQEERNIHRDGDEAAMDPYKLIQWLVADIRRHNSF